ncbi:MAG: flippase-like domain-containing protein [Ignavibacteriales bacterium]|nr:hypothetical protein [Ignavibacteriaceae bacterium]MBW7873111.1 flippase-like domain-containing protein [Ignavibacteria bacterium]MBZ0196309.1 flippase-like domain-containing protein [Ignavibacteriaceae bacterium]MCZ2142754.1 flippase-like domain-containing protein [Ignavibacteriales bacterium]WKZ71483.1 MAG: lysylphosphatidylglycerol synthase transmembrane domain-containing protein [Ignavibacteriaceae bacterium]
MTSAKKKLFSFREVIIYVISLLLTALFLYWAFKGVNTTELWDNIRSASLFWLLMLVLFQMLAHWFRALRWKAIMESLKPDVSSLNLLGAVLIGYGLNNVVPRMGEVARAVAVGKTEKLSKTSILGTVVVERIIDMSVFAFAVVLSGWIYEGDIYSGELSWLKLTLEIGTLAFIVLITGLILLIRFKERFSDLATSWVSKFSERSANKLEELFHKMIVGFSTLKTKEAYFKTVIYSVLIMLGYAATSWAGFYALGMEAKYSVLGFGAAWIIMSISAIGVMIPTPGGIGSVHTITKSALLMLYSIPAELGLAFATFQHGVTYLLHFVVAGAFLVYFKFKLPGMHTGDMINLEDNGQQS